MVFHRPGRGEEEERGSGHSAMGQGEGGHQTPNAVHQ